MPINPTQLAAGANYQLQSYAQNDPIDQFTVAHPLSQWLVSNKIESIYGNGIFNEKVRITNDSNYQNYTRDDQVTYNTRDTVRLAAYQHYEAHDGFTLNETDMADNGIILTDDKEAVMSGAEKIQIVNRLKEDYQVLKNGFQTNWDLEAHRDGTQSTKAVPGLDLLVSTTPNTGTVGGIDAGTATYWRNTADLNISTASAGTLTTHMEQAWRACMTYGGMPPDYILVGSAFLDAYRADALNTINRQLVINGKGGTNIDNGVGNGSKTGVYFKGVELVWDPQFDVLQSLLAPTVNWSKRCYFLQSQHLILRPNKGRWMVNRKPPRIYDRYSYFFGLTADYGITMKKRNSMAVLSIA